MAINDEWPDEWDKEHGRFTKKWSTPDLPPTATKLVASIKPDWVAPLVHIPNLETDETLFGAGLHCIPSGGFLKMHCDFNVHPDGRLRRVNMLIYLNLDWKKEWGGELILSETPDPEGGKKVAPIGGRCVIFETNSKTWHGHPAPLACPEGVQRRSLALYFYTREKPYEAPRTTVYVK